FGVIKRLLLEIASAPRFVSGPHDRYCSQPTVGSIEHISGFLVHLKTPTSVSPLTFADRVPISATTSSCDHSSTSAGRFSPRGPSGIGMMRQISTDLVERPRCQ